MSADEEDLPPEIDTSKPHPARVYDYFLGGKDNFAADRAIGDQMLRAWPMARQAARENRTFVGRAVRYLADEAGIAQFLDIGSGLPCAGNVHEVAQSVNPAARVVYVDNDPIVLVHGQALLTSGPEGKTAYIHADLREPEHILKHPVTTSTLDFSQPVGLILASVLHFLPDEDEPARIMATLIGALPPGSYLAASHGTVEYSREASDAMDAARRGSDVRGQMRTLEEFADLAFPGLTLVPPGIVPAPEWRPGPDAIIPPRNEDAANAGVARKP